MMPPAPVLEGTKATESIQGRAHPAPFVLGQGIGSPDLLSGLYAINITQARDEIIPWGYYPYRRDRQLRSFAQSENICAGAIYSVRSRLESLAYKVTGKPRAKKLYSDVIGESEFGAGLSQLVGKTVYDLLTQDNGAFWELVGAGRPDKALRGPVMQVNHIDSSRCWRTFDPEYPVIYYNPYTTEFHKMHYTRVVCMSDNTQPDEIAHNIGFCAVSRSVRSIQIMRDIAIYKQEKISGRFRRAILMLQGFTTKQVDQAMQTSMDADDSAGLTRFHNIPVLASVAADMDYKLINLAQLPDGFDTEKDTTLYVYCLALAFGVDAREFWPATASGATKADATVQHTKAQGKGIGRMIQIVENGMNWHVLRDTGAEFEYDYTDDEQDLQKAQIDQTKITNINLMVTGGYLNANEARAIAISQEVIDPQVIQNIAAPVAADENSSLQDQVAGDTTAPPPETQDGKPPITEPAVKEDKKAPPVTDEEIAAARRELIKLGIHLESYRADE